MVAEQRGSGSMEGLIVQPGAPVVLAPLGFVQTGEGGIPVTPVLMQGDRAACTCGKGPRIRGAAYCHRCGGVMVPTPPPAGQMPDLPAWPSPTQHPQQQNVAMPPMQVNVELPVTPRAVTPRRAGTPRTPQTVGGTPRGSGGDDDDGGSRRRRLSEVGTTRSEDPIAAMQQALQAMNRQMSVQLSDISTGVGKVKTDVGLVHMAQQRQ